jgi:hypothetical protein
MAQGKEQKKKNYILRNPGMVMKRFYERVVCQELCKIAESG